jgi:protein-tyrosine phosphatase
MERIRGRPEMGWKSWLEDLKIQWFVFDLEDPRPRLHDATGFCEDVASVCLSWMEMCRALLQHLTQTPGILFHCFGGINRSSAALCAWLIFRHGLTTKEAVRSLLAARPTLCPWTHRPHVLWALHTWEKNQDQVIRPRILAEVLQMSVSTPGPA